MQSSRISLLICVHALLILIGICSFVFWKETFLNKRPITQQEQPAQDTSKETAITLRFVGDIMLDRGVEFQIKKNGQHWNWPFLRIAHILQETDFLFGNLESVISDKGTNVGSIYSFRADPLSIEGLAFAGFDMLSVANNHSMDYTRAAFEDSLFRLQQSGITPVGGKTAKEPAFNPAFITIKDMKIAALAYTTQGSPLWNTNVSWMDEFRIDQLRESISSAKTLSDIVIVSFHWGDEYATTPNSFQETLGKAAIDAGASIVIGHHTHIVQPLERYNHGWIAYSLGNFIFDQNFSEETMKGAILKVDVENGVIKNAVLEHTTLNDSFQVSIME